MITRKQVADELKKHSGKSSEYKAQKISEFIDAEHKKPDNTTSVDKQKQTEKQKILSDLRSYAEY